MAEIAAALATEKRRNALSDFLAKVEEQFEGGANLPEVAKSLGLPLRPSRAGGTRATYQRSWPSSLRAKQSSQPQKLSSKNTAFLLWMTRPLRGSKPNGRCNFRRVCSR